MDQKFDPEILAKHRSVPRADNLRGPAKAAGLDLGLKGVIAAAHACCNKRTSGVAAAVKRIAARQQDSQGEKI